MRLVIAVLAGAGSSCNLGAPNERGTTDERNRRGNCALPARPASARCTGSTVMLRGEVGGRGVVEYWLEVGQLQGMHDLLDGAVVVDMPLL